MRRIKRCYLWALAGLFILSSCVELDITTPKGKKGEPGEPGLSDFELWQVEVNAGRIEWNKDETSLPDFFRFLKGNDGKDGVDGTPGEAGKSAYESWKARVEAGLVYDPHQPGSTWPADKTSIADFWRYLTGSTGEVGPIPHIDKESGHWFIGLEDTGTSARGEKGDRGEDAVPPVLSIINGFWAVDGKVTDQTATPIDAKEGVAPISISANGKWVIYGVETNTDARGTDGRKPEVSISSSTGNWVINGVDSGKRAFGKNGKTGLPGRQGKSAYQLWKEEAQTGNMENPHSESDPKEKWPANRISEVDFWSYLMGK